MLTSELNETDADVDADVIAEDSKPETSVADNDEQVQSDQEQEDDEHSEKPETLESPTKEVKEPQHNDDATNEAELDETDQVSDAVAEDEDDSLTDFLATVE